MVYFQKQFSKSNSFQKKTKTIAAILYKHYFRQGRVVFHLLYIIFVYSISLSFHCAHSNECI